MNFSRKQIIASTFIVLITMAVAVLIWRSPPSQSADTHGSSGHHDEHDHDQDAGHEAGHEAESPGNGSSASNAHADHAEHADEVMMTDAAVKASGIQIATAAAGAVNGELLVPGEIGFNQDRLAHVTPRFPGIAVKVFKGLGATVRKGETLVIIDSPLLADLRSQYLAAAKRHELAQTVFERERKLWESRISPEQDYLTARKDLAETQIELDALQGRLAALGASARSKDGLARYALVAPQDGIIVEKHVSVGEAVKDDADLFLIADLRTVWAEVTLQPRMLGQLREGQAVRITSSDLAAEVQGTIASIGSLIGEQTRTAKARVLVPNAEGQWRPGLFVNVAVTQGNETAAVTVPPGAVQIYENREVVFVRSKDGFVVRPIKAGRRNAERVEVIEGLKAGERVAARNSFVVKADLGKASAEHEH